jgi:hypothetical protein
MGDGITGYTYAETKDSSWNTTLEVFTISEGAAVPEPGTLNLFVIEKPPVPRSSVPSALNPFLFILAWS